ncbi:MAG: hypothetical protein H7A46_10385 [Verrucomicrobiales bacterium]|nr:hypothetical protein [Verrucomicrobiales bacterium]
MERRDADCHGCRCALQEPAAPPDRAHFGWLRSDGFAVFCWGLGLPLLSWSFANGGDALRPWQDIGFPATMSVDKLARPQQLSGLLHLRLAQWR